MFVDKLSDKAYVLLLFAVSTGFLMIGIGNGLSLYDEGLMVYGASRILHGDVPYRDFWTIYGPGQFYLLAGLFKVCGQSIFAERVVTVVIQALTAVCIFFITRRFVSRRLATLGWSMVIVWYAIHTFFASPMPAALLFAMASCLCLMEYAKVNSRKWLFVAGIVAAVSALFRHDIGIYVVAAESIVIITFSYLNQGNGNPANTSQLRRSVLGLVCFISGFIVVVLPPILFLVSNVGARELLSDLFIFPLKIFPKYRGLPYPPLFPAPTQIISGNMSIGGYARETLEYYQFYFPLIILVIAGLYLLMTLRSLKSLSVNHWILLLLTLLTMTFFNQARVRSNVLHLTPMMISIAAMLPLMHVAFTRSAKSSVYNLIRIVFTIAVVAIVVSLGCEFYRTVLQKVNVAHKTSRYIPLDLPAARGVRMAPENAESLAKAVSYIQQRVSPQEKIFVGLARHDKIGKDKGNNIAFYFLSNRHSATKYYELHPGLATNALIQNQIISDIKNSSVRYIVIHEKDEKQDDTSSKDDCAIPGAGDLDEFINNFYSEAQSFGSYHILVHK